jgi:hypothetical protein
MKKKLFEVAVLKRTEDHDRDLLISPTPVMANDEESAKLKGAFLAHAQAPNLNTDDMDILVRPFHSG